MKIAIHGRKFNESSKPFMAQFFNELNITDMPWQISGSFYEILKQSEVPISSPKIFNNPKEIFEADMVISLGGDGTFLETLSYVGPKEIPVFGINFGRLGFLASANPVDVKEILEDIVLGKFYIEDRTLVKVESGIDELNELNFALNEIAITKTDTSSMIVIHSFVDDEFLNSYWADGLMVSTPTGSTGYSLSCGGPVVLPHSANLIITPICPHNLFVRPMIISDNSVVKLRVESRSNNFLVALDARATIASQKAQDIFIRKEKFAAKLVQLTNDNFLKTLRTKLNWGIDARN